MIYTHRDEAREPARANDSISHPTGLGSNASGIARRVKDEYVAW